MEEILHLIDLLSTWTLRVSHSWQPSVILGVFLAYGIELPVRFRMKVHMSGTFVNESPKPLGPEPKVIWTCHCLMPFFPLSCSSEFFGSFVLTEALTRMVDLQAGPAQGLLSPTRKS